MTKNKTVGWPSHGLIDKLDSANNGEEDARIIRSLEGTGKYSTKYAIICQVKVPTWLKAPLQGWFEKVNDQRRFKTPIVHGS